jgi:hypothetical protein
MTALIRDFRPQRRHGCEPSCASGMGPVPRFVFRLGTKRGDLRKCSELGHQSRATGCGVDGSIVGCVIYVGPGREREGTYDSTWSIVRMLSVDPAARGEGIGRPSRSLY